MQLPYSQTKDGDLNQIQNKWKAVLDPLLSIPITQGSLLTGVKLSNGTTIINHKLGRKLVGWFVVGINGAATIFDNQANNQMSDLTLSLTSNAAVAVNLWVF